jgi:Plavaka transposase
MPSHAMIFPGIPCNERGKYLPPYTRPPSTTAPINADDTNPWDPFSSRSDFDFAHFLFIEVQNSAKKIDRALDILAGYALEYSGVTPWKDSAELYSTIDAIQDGNAPWKVYHIHYKGPRPPGTPPKWMTETYELCTRDSHRILHHQLSTAQFKDKFNVAPYRQVNDKGVHIWSNLMSGDWAWKQAVRDMDSRYIEN